MFLGGGPLGAGLFLLLQLDLQLPALLLFLPLLLQSFQLGLLGIHQLPSLFLDLPPLRRCPCQKLALIL
jgi:hypothetical protein